VTKPQEWNEQVKEIVESAAPGGILTIRPTSIFSISKSYLNIQIYNYTDI
jgi:hypothetical protein